MNTDKAWELWGARDPYFAVLTDEQYRAARLGDPQREAFFESGRHHVQNVLRAVEALSGRGFDQCAALDFGCGVGRLVIPFAATFETVTGVDISRSMLDEARRNCDEAGVENVRLALTHDFLTHEDGNYDLVHSALVFQHIRPAEGQRLLAALLGRVAPRGFAALHLMFHRGGLPRVLTWIRDRLPYGYVVTERLRGRRSVVAPMEMNSYDMNRVLLLLQDHGFDRMRLSLSRRGGISSVFVFACRSSDR